ncbi:COG1470 family protein [Actinokineospora sp. 24-640]
MKTAIILGSASLSVAAGDEATCEIRVRNGGQVVDQFSVDLIGETVPWTRAEPATVNLMPGGEVTVALVFAPPKSSEVLAGTYAFAVRVRSREDPDSAVVEEGRIDVEPFTELDTELLPTRRRGRTRARYQLAVENAGNTPVRTEVEPFDPEDDQLDIRLNRTFFTVQPGTVALLKVRVKPYDRFLRGEPRNHPFELRVLRESDNDAAVAAEPMVAKGLMVQERMLPTWVLPILAVLALLAVALTTLWFAVVAPGVKSIANEQVQSGVSAANSAADAADAAAQRADGHAQEIQASLSAAPTPPAPQPLDFRVATFADPVTDGSFQRFTFTAPQGRVMQIVDVLLQNPRSDVGYLRIGVGDKVLSEFGLANFTDKSITYSNPLRVEPGRPVVISVNCVTPGAGSARCTPSVTFSGTTVAPPSSTRPAPPSASAQGR